VFKKLQYDKMNVPYAVVLPLVFQRF